MKDLMMAWMTGTDISTCQFAPASESKNKGFWASMVLFALARIGKLISSSSFL